MTDDAVKGLMQDMETSFTRNQDYTLVGPEVEVAYLALCRLEYMESLAAKRDWETLKRCCPAQEVQS